MDGEDAITVVLELMQDKYTDDILKELSSVTADDGKYRLTNIEHNALEILLMKYYKAKAKAELLESELKPITNLNIPIKTLISEYERLNEMEDEIDKLKYEIAYKDKESLDYMNSDKGKIIKENKELKEMLIHRVKYTNKLEQDLFEGTNNYIISKDKIRNKIKEIEKDELLEKIDFKSCKFTIEILKDLLEE